MGVATAADWSADLASVLLTEEAIQARVADLARQIAVDYEGQNPLLIGVLKGSVVFLCDLVRAMGMPVEIDLVCVSSYGQGAQSCGEITILKDVSAPVQGRHVLIVEDILDSGLTIRHLAALLRDRAPASLRACALLSKPSRRKVECEADYLGFEIPDEFVVGYGLDYAERFRWLPYVAVLRPEAYS
ncbi:MAG: hypoxanthine phosphoribosyltransferase [Armatimonadota bacterium]